MAALMLVTAVSCVTDGSGEKYEQRQVRESFEEWAAAGARKDWETVSDRLSDRMRTLMIHAFVKGGNVAVIEEHIQKLPESDRKDMLKWVARNGLRDEGEVDMVPVRVLRSPWLKETVTALLALNGDDLVPQFAAYRVTRVYCKDGENAATLLALNIRQGSEMFSLIYDGENWLVDGHRQSHGFGR